ncbi:hypothetical protein Tco_0782221 [Tanacetum coccineum]
MHPRYCKPTKTASPLAGGFDPRHHAPLYPGLSKSNTHWYPSSWGYNTNHHTHPLVAAVVVVYDDVRVAVLGLPWGGSGRGDGDGDDVGGVMVMG